MRRLFFTTVIAITVIFFNFWSGNFLRGVFLSVIEKPSLFLTEKVFELKVLAVSLANYSIILEENKSLYLQNHELSDQKVRLTSLEEKYNQLRKQFLLPNPEPEQLKPVRIFLFSYGPKSAGAFIDKGEESGIKKGQAVIYGGNILIGIVQETFLRQSRVMLITDPDFRVNARTSDKTQTLASGAMEKGLALEFIAAGDNIKEGESLITNGLDGLLEDLLIGKIKKVESNSGDLFKKVFIEPAFEKVKSTHAFVIIQ